MYEFYFFAVASSVISVTATQNDPDTVSNKYDYTFVCTIHPESTADTCAVTVMNGGIIMKSKPVAIVCAHLCCSYMFYAQ